MGPGPQQARGHRQRTTVPGTGLGGMQANSLFISFLWNSCSLLQMCSEVETRVQSPEDCADMSVKEALEKDLVEAEEAAG